MKGLSPIQHNMTTFRQEMLPIQMMGRRINPVDKKPMGIGHPPRVRGNLASALEYSMNLTNITRNQMKTSIDILTKTVHQFDRQASSSQQNQFRDAENDFIEILSEARKSQTDHFKNNRRKPWHKKLSSGLHTFCETIIHYEKVLDVLNGQAPIFTSHSGELSK